MRMFKSADAKFMVLAAALGASVLPSAGPALAASGIDTPSGTTSLPFSIQGTTYMTLTPTGLGIGTTAPSNQLHIYNSQNASTWAEVQNPNTGAIAQAGLAAVTGLGTAYFGIDGSGYSPTPRAWVWSTGNGPLVLATNNTEYIRITSSGDVGIGTANPQQRLEVDGASNCSAPTPGTGGIAFWYKCAEGGTITLNDSSTNPNTLVHLENINGTFRLVNSAWNTQLFSVDQSGNVWANSGVTATAYYHSSDRELKEHVEIVSNALDMIGKLRGVTFVWKKDGKASAGIIAQDVQKVLPSAVMVDGQGYLAVDYDQLFAPVIEAIKELKADNDRLHAELNDQEREIAQLKAAY